MNLPMLRIRSIGKKLFILTAALITAAALASTAFAQPITQAQEQIRLMNNCHTVTIPQSDHVQTLLDPTTGVVKIEWFVGELAQTTELPLVAPANCNAGNKALLQRVNKVYTDQVNDTCREFRQYIVGRKLCQ